MVGFDWKGDQSLRGSCGGEVQGLELIRKPGEEAEFESPQPRGIDGSTAEQGVKLRDTGYLGVKREKQRLQGFLLEAKHKENSLL